MVTIELFDRYQASITEGDWQCETEELARDLEDLFPVEDDPADPDPEYTAAAAALAAFGGRWIRHDPPPEGPRDLVVATTSLSEAALTALQTTLREAIGPDWGGGWITSDDGQHLYIGKGGSIHPGGPKSAPVGTLKGFGGTKGEQKGGDKGGGKGNGQPGPAVTDPLRIHDLSAEDTIDGQRKAGTFVDSPTRSAKEQKAMVATALATRLTDDPDFAEYVAQLKTRFPAPTDWKPHYIKVPEGVDEDTYLAVHHSIQTWANTSMDSDDLSVSMQQAAVKEFGLTTHTMPAGQPAQDSAQAVFGNVEAGQRRFLRTMYDHTQEELEKAGIESVVLYRGMRFQYVPETGQYKKAAWMKQIPSGTVAPVLAQTQPMNSYTTALGTAQDFGAGHVILATQVPRSRIVGSAMTGFGCKDEREFVVLGGTDPHFITAEPKTMGMEKELPKWIAKKSALASATPKAKG